MISLSSSYNTNPYIIAASLADVNKWPELAMSSSPQLSDDEGERPSGFPGATGLKHTQTIMGSKSGGMGLRVSGSRRASALKRGSGVPRQDDVKNFLSNSALTHDDTNINVVAPSGTSLGERNTETWVNPTDKDKFASSKTAQEQEQNPNLVDPAAKVVQFIPRFKGASEMEARRKLRMAARRGPGGAILAPQQILTINPELSSSSSSDEILIDDEEDEFDDMAVQDDNGDDEFDP
jgi:hypothetical protein